MISGMTQDVTELAEARDAAIRGEQAAQAAAEAKSQFLANMSHEIRTPMNGVLGVLHLLKSEELSDEGRRAARGGAGLRLDAGRAAQRRDRLLQDRSRPAGAVARSRSTRRRRSRASPACCGPRPKAKGPLAADAIAPDIGWVSIDPVRLRQMLFNLIGNAVKFTLDGGVEVRLSASGAGQRLRVEIEDTGIGIAEEAQSRLSSASTRPTARPPGASAARASASPSPGGWPS